MQDGDAGTARFPGRRVISYVPVVRHQLGFRAQARKTGAENWQRDADVAQLVEQRFRKPQVVGSIPTVGSSFGRARRGVSGSFIPKQFGLASNPL